MGGGKGRVWGGGKGRVWGGGRKGEEAGKRKRLRMREESWRLE